MNIQRKESLELVNVGVLLVEKVWKKVIEEKTNPVVLSGERQRVADCGCLSIEGTSVCCQWFFFFFFLRMCQWVFGYEDDA